MNERQFGPHKTLKPNPLPDQHQTFWQMASIQSASFGVPVLQFGASMGVKYGAGRAMASICIGNLVLWLVGLAIIAMTIKDRRNAIENLVEYIGKYGCWLGGFALSLAFLFWYPIQIKGSVMGMRVALEPYLQLSQVFDIRIGAALGLIVALLSIGGIKLIKWLCVYSLPFLIVYIIYAAIRNNGLASFKGTWGVSLTVIVASISVTLAGIINLPTFFRHRRSAVDAYFALSIFVFLTMFIECAAVLLQNVNTGEFFTRYMRGNGIDVTLLVLFLLFSMFCVNLSNIYFASAVWEEIFPWVSYSRELSIIGMGGTLVFAFFQAQPLMVYLETLFTTYIGVLGIVIIMGYAVKRIVEHRVRRLELIISFLCWMIGCATVTWIQDIDLKNSSHAFFSGIGASALFFLIVLFIEESAWAFKKATWE